MKPFAIIAAFSLGCWACAAAAYLWVDRSLSRISW